MPVKKRKVAKKRKPAKRKVAKKKKATKRKKLTKGTWTKDDIKLLKKLFGNNLTSEVAKALGRPYDAVKKKAARMGLRKSKSYMKKLGRG